MSRATIKVWDPLVRLFHWSLVAGYAIAWLTAEELDTVHEWAGYVVAGLLGFRILWGLVGPKYARFGQFLRSPAAVVQYVRAMIRGEEQRYVGHNPVGGVMVISLILALAGASLTGWMATLDSFWGVEWVKDVHESLANLTLLMVAAHVAGVILTSLRHKENLARAMILGHKRAPEAADIV